MSYVSSSAPQYPHDKLTWVERLAIGIGRRINRPGIIRSICVWWGKVFTCAVLKRVTGHRWVHIHAEPLHDVPSNRPILIVSNHRTFFDMYVGITALRYLSKYRIGAPAVFPVRAPFFYDSILGIWINLLFSGGCMWPPVFRDDRKKELNAVTKEMMKELLQQDGVCFGYHPEGRRSKSSDPYTLDPPKRGVGELLQGAREDLVIIPLFISGLSGNVKKEWHYRKKTYSKSAPIRFYWGEPKLANEFSGNSEEIAEQIHVLIQSLGNEAKQAEVHIEE